MGSKNFGSISLKAYVRGQAFEEERREQRFQSINFMSFLTTHRISGSKQGHRALGRQGFCHSKVSYSLNQHGVVWAANSDIHNGIRLGRWKQQGGEESRRKLEHGEKEK